jgi:adenylate cyclase
MSPDADSAVLRGLLQDAEFEAERTIGWVRIAIALTLAAGVWFAVPWMSAEDPGFTTRVIASGLTLGALMALGIASLMTASGRRYRSWFAYAFTAADAVLVSLNLWTVLNTHQLSGSWTAALPAILVVPLLMAVGTLRYRPAVQIWATAWFVAGLSAAALTRGLDGPGLSSDVAPFFALAPNTMRLLILILIGATTTYVIMRAYRLLVRASREAVQRAMLARFLPSEVAPLVAGSGEGAWRRGRRQRVAILFVDMRGSTKIAEEMDPAQLSVFVSSFRRRITRAARAFPGVIDKFIGDGAMIIFGVPAPGPDDAGRAVNCGREIIRLVENWSAKRNFQPPVRVGVGIHIGEAYCGIVGDEDRLEFTVLGDAVNVAARIEQATKEFAEPLLVSEDVAREAGGPGAWREVTRDPLRGRLHQIGIFAPIP